MSFPSDGGAPRFGVMILLSMLLHLVVIVGGGSWKLAPSYRLTFGPVYEVKLVDRLPTPDKNLGVETEGLSGLSGKSPWAVKKEETTIPIRRIERETTVSPEVKKALEEIKKKTAQSPTSPASSPSRGGGDENAFHAYLRLMWERIRGGWVLPPGLFPQDRWEAVVNLRVLRSGKLMDVKLEKSSGNAYFDRSVLRAVQKADPLPPFPPDLHEDAIEVGIRFHSQEAPR
ncbi:MAG TPA: energy transducer TonB [Syntrophales bacterium]|nr:energy transducer TonB [Syntrophales bacterium]HOL58344.1 energy transducer TonB [Syntrophales bacterium]HPO34513.1 energy transducer TonB [Syntrophales bacterium]